MTLFFIFATILAGSAGVTCYYYWDSPYGRFRRASRKSTNGVHKFAKALIKPLRDAELALKRSALQFAQSQRRNKLSSTPLRELAKQGARNVRWSALEEANIGVEDLANRPPAAFTSIAGVGSATAESCVAAAKKLRSQINSEPAEPPGPELSTATIRNLVGSARHVLDQRSALGTRGAAATKAANQAKDRQSQIDRLSSLKWWLFPKPHNKAKLRKLCEEHHVACAKFLANERIASELASQPHSGVSESANTDLATDYRRRYADYIALIEPYLDPSSTKATGTDFERSGVARGLPLEIARRVEAFPLSTATLRIDLRLYQVFGAKYILTQQRTVLGDEMGLGKTVEALAAMSHLREKEDAPYFLVVCPASITHNWQREIDSRTGIASYLAHGSIRQTVIKDWLVSKGIVITSYEGLRSGEITKTLKKTGIRIALSVIDEAHYVKNPTSGRSRAVRELAALSHRICLLTGTPLENRLSEFREIVNFAQPDVARKIPDEDVGYSKIASMVAPAYLRRNQTDVLRELPPRIEKDEWIELSQDDLAAYKAAIIRGTYMAMRQAVTTGDGSGRSAKLGRVAELLSEYHESGKKVIIFSFFLETLELLAKRFEVTGTLRGSVNHAKRMELIDRFNSVDGHAVLLSQIDAGGVGLNLQTASVVILMEPQFKPTTEDQAIARAHRMGQVDHVIVHRLLAYGTLEEKLVERLKAKRQTFDDHVRESALRDASSQATEASFGKQMVESEYQRHVG